jgi:hypothetical protein
MGIQKNFPERRKDKRFKLKYPVFAVMYYSPTRIGRITDISRSGLAVRYVKNGESSNELNELGIFKSDFRFYIDNIRAKTISDFEIIDKTFIGSKEMRRCGIQFGDLPKNQISQLEDLIQNFTSAEGLN